MILRGRIHDPTTTAGTRVVAPPPIVPKLIRRCGAPRDCAVVVDERMRFVSAQAEFSPTARAVIAEV